MCVWGGENCVWKWMHSTCHAHYARPEKCPPHPAFHRCPVAKGLALELGMFSFAKMDYDVMQVKDLDGESSPGWNTLNATTVSL